MEALLMPYPLTEITSASTAFFTADTSSFHAPTITSLIIVFTHLQNFYPLL
jgi:hypothetical protein